MSFFGKLFGQDSIVQAGIDGIDAIVYTDEEKARNKLLILKAYEPFKLAQRMLMLVVSLPYMACWVGTFIASCWGADVTSQQLLLDGDIGTVFLTINGFYFGGGLVEGAIKTYKGDK